MGIEDGAGGGDSTASAKDRYAGLATLLRSRREALGISRRDLAAATGLSYPYIAQLEGGYRAPSVTTARRLADALRLPVEEIVHATGEATTTTTAPAPAARLPVGRDDAWLANPAYAPGIAAERVNAFVAVPAAPTVPRPTEPSPAAAAPSATAPTAPASAAPASVAPTSPATPTPTPAPPSPAAPAPSAPTSTPPASPAPASAAPPTPTPAPAPPAPVALPSTVAPPSVTPPPVAAPSSARHGLFGRRRDGSAREPSGGAPAPLATPGPAVDPVAATAEQITALLRALPASDRLDALAAVQRDVLAQLVEDRIRSDSRQPGT